MLRSGSVDNKFNFMSLIQTQRSFFSIKESNEKIIKKVNCPGYE